MMSMRQQRARQPPAYLGMVTQPPLPMRGRQASVSAESILRASLAKGWKRTKVGGGAGVGVVTTRPRRVGEVVGIYTGAIIEQHDFEQEMSKREDAA